MRVKELVKDLVYRTNPLAVMRRKKMRRPLTNKTPSLLCPNCLGGILFHDLALQFRSPTVNLMMKQPDFVKLVLNLDHYLDQELRFFEKPGYSCPCAKLDDLTVHFTHYPSPEAAAQKWEERKRRIDRDNLFVFAAERDGLTKEEIVKLGRLKCRGLVVFTAGDYPDIPYAVQIPKYAKQGFVGNILEKNWKDESREYEQYFDFVRWLNEANGAPYDAGAFVR